MTLDTRRSRRRGSERSEIEKFLETNCALFSANRDLNQGLIRVVRRGTNQARAATAIPSGSVSGAGAAAAGPFAAPTKFSSGGAAGLAGAEKRSSLEAGLLIVMESTPVGGCY